MASVSPPAFIRRFLAILLMGAGLFVGWFGVLMLVQVVTAHGSRGGNIYLTGLGVTLLVFSPVVIIAGIVYWRSSDRGTQDFNS
jgi:hypothetical protein